MPAVASASDEAADAARTAAPGADTFVDANDAGLGVVVGGDVVAGG
jgi:hypothetical protein